MRTLLTALTLAAVALPAAAQPLLHPSRDVVVEYRNSASAAGPPGGHMVRMYFAEQGMKMRVESVGAPSYMIIDRGSHSVIMVMTAQHVYMNVPYDPQRAMAFDNPQTTFTRQGTDTIAGYACTVYDAHSPQHDSKVCITSDGVLLRAESNDPAGRGELVATNVTYGPQPARMFQPPEGFRKFDTSQMPPGMGTPPRQ